jgi:hypothetical protein
MTENLFSADDCSEIIRQSADCAGGKVIDYVVSSYCDGYPGFLGEYYALTIKFYVRKSDLS